MKLLAISDIHGNTAALPSITDDLKACDAIILSGDITHFGGAEAMAAVLDELKKYSLPIYAVAGNCDQPLAATALAATPEGIERKKAEIGGLFIAGIGGSLPCPGSTPNEFGEADFKRVLEIEPFSSLDPGAFILVSHQPPCNTKADKAWIGAHVGSREIRKFIEIKKALVCVTGHIHESRCVDTLGDTRIVNPGAFKSGNYAVVEVDKNGVRDISLKSV
jgi:uncharacterized protein